MATILNIYEDKEKEPSKTFKEVYKINKETNPYLKKLEEENIHFHIVTKEDSINKARHKIQIEKDTLLHEIFQEKTKDVVSLHGMAIARAPKSVCVSAKAEDDIIEAIEYRKKRCFIVRRTIPSRN